MAEAELTYSPGDVRRENLRAMLDDLFTGPSVPVFQGYVDDGRNTDNAWYETTAVHFHCSRQLGGMLPLTNEFSTDRAFNARWITVDPTERGYRSLFSTHKQYVDRVRDNVVRQLHAGLLQLVVRWGRPQILSNVLRSPSLVEQRQPWQVQQAFNDALRLATSPTYDTRVIELLLDNGAKAADVFAAALFDLEGDSRYGDAFGYCSGMVEVLETNEGYGIVGRSRPRTARTGIIELPWVGKEAIVTENASMLSTAKSKSNMCRRSARRVMVRNSLSKSARGVMVRNSLSNSTALKRASFVSGVSTMLAKTSRCEKEGKTKAVHPFVLVWMLQKLRRNGRCAQ